MVTRIFEFYKNKINLGSLRRIYTILDIMNYTKSWNMYVYKHRCKQYYVSFISDIIFIPYF